MESTLRSRTARIVSAGSTDIIFTGRDGMWSRIKEPNATEIPMKIIKISRPFCVSYFNDIGILIAISKRPLTIANISI